jgi:hypothetical protein
MPVTATFFPVDIASPQIIGSGRTRIMTSVSKFDIEFPQKKVCGSMQVPPGISLFQVKAIGLHWKRAVKKTAIHHMMTSTPATILAMEKFRDALKRRR